MIQDCQTTIKNHSTIQVNCVFPLNSTVYTGLVEIQNPRTDDTLDKRLQNKSVIFTDFDQGLYHVRVFDGNSNSGPAAYEYLHDTYT